MKRLIYIAALTATSIISLLSLSGFYLLPRYFGYHFALMTNTPSSISSVNVGKETIFVTKTPPPYIGAKSVYLMDANSGQVLLNNNGSTELPIASITKIMTAIIAINNGNLEDEYTVGQDAVSEVTNNAGSSANLVVGDKVKLKDLLYGLLLPSGDDAAIVIADGMSGSQDKFVALMNDYARRLDLSDTHFINADGLTYTQNGKGVYNTSTAEDLMKLTKYALKNPLFTQIVQTESFSLAKTSTNTAYTWQNTNDLLSSLPGITGVKTGFTDEAGYCLLFSVTDGRKKLIGVILNDSTTDSNKRFSDVSNLISWGFTQE